VSGDGVISHRAGLRVALLREICDNPVLRERWNALVDRVDQPQVFYTYEWALAVWRTYSATLRPLLFLAYDEQESLCAVAALATNPSGTEVSFLCATTGDYCDFLCLPEQKRPFLDVILAELRQQGIGSVTLANLPADSSTMAVLEQAAKKQRYFYFARTGYLCAQVSLNQVERRTDGRLVVPGGKRLRRLTNAMARTAPVHFEHARSWNEAQAILSQFARAHVVRFLVTGRISNLARLERRLFLEELAKLLSESGWLAISRATAGTRAIAWNYGFQFHGTWFWYQPTFDSDLEKYSPGFCLLARLIEEAAGDKSFELIDLGLGAEEYKERFGNRTRETLHVTLQTSVVSHIRTIVRFRAATMVKAVPGLELRVRAVAEKLLRVRGRARERGLAGTLFWLARRVGDLFWSRTEVFFFEWCGPAASDHEGWELRPLKLEQ
jgi:CelD/BcsL family acetyltransferase involved in cellulose biosynthesis